MKYLLDTNICIYLIRKRPLSVMQKFEDFSIGEIGTSSVTAAELYYGVQKSRHQAQNRIALLQFLAPLSVSGFTLNPPLLMEISEQHWKPRGHRTAV